MSKVYVGNKFSGRILRGEKGYFYKPNRSEACGDVFETIEAVKRSLEVE